MKRLWVMLSGFKFKVAVVARKETSETDEHLAERWVNIKVEFALDVVGPEFTCNNKETSKRKTAVTRNVVDK